MESPVSTKGDTDKRRNRRESEMNKTKMAQADVSSQTLSNKRDSSTNTDKGDQGQTHTRQCQTGN